MRNGITFSRNTRSLPNRARKCENTFGELDISRVRFFRYFSRLFFVSQKWLLCFVKSQRHFLLCCTRFNHIDKITNLVRSLSPYLSSSSISLVPYIPFSTLLVLVHGEKEEKTTRIGSILCSAVYYYHCYCYTGIFTVIISLFYYIQ